MEIEALTCGHPGLLLLHRSRPVWESLLLTLGKFCTPLHYSTPFPVHLPSRHCPLFGGKGRATDLKQALLGRQPKNFFAFEKKKGCVFPLSPALFHFGVLGTPLSLVFFIVFFIEDNENLKYGG